MLAVFVLGEVLLGELRDGFLLAGEELSRDGADALTL